MQPLLNWSLLLLLELVLITCATAEIASPYCYKNVTETSYKVVTKTRMKTIAAKGFFKKLTNKKETQVEIYEDQEPVHKIKVQRSCCDGYKLTELDLCEPQCVENGCPQHSRCVEPEVCECITGYFSKRSSHDAKHYCEPICEKPCPEYSVCVAHNECACKKGYHVANDQQCKPFCASNCPHEGKCVAPNVCDCAEGYRSEKGSCLPICSLGDQCQNGNCVDKEECICKYGFSWNYETLKCEHDLTSITDDPDYFTESQRSTDLSLEWETDIDTSTNDIDPNQVFDEYIETSTFSVTDEYGSSTQYSEQLKHKCAEDYVFHNGQCRPMKFVSNEIDCWLKPCEDINAVCLENGTCACNDGFQWFQTHIVNSITLNQTFKAVCLSDSEYKIRTQQLSEDLNTKPVKDATNWSTIFFVVLGFLIMVVALVVLGLKLFYRQSGEVDVEGKNLTCVYDKRACSETDKAVI